MGQIISVAVSSAYEIYRRTRPRPLAQIEDINVIKQPEDWAWNQRNNDDALQNELNKLKRLISNNLVKTKDLNYARAIKGIKNENLDDTYAKYLFPSDPIWYGPYKTVETYIESQKTSFDTLISYSFNKTKDFYLVRFTDDSNNLNINLIRQMYHCLELFWVKQGNHIDNRSEGKEIYFNHPFNQSQIQMKISTLRSMYGYYNSTRNSFYIQDRFIIADFMKLITIMFGENNIVGYYYDDTVFHPEFTILGSKQHEVLPKAQKMNSSISKNGTRLWSLGGGVKLLQEPQTLHNHIFHTKDTLIEIEKNDELIPTMQEFFNYQYQCILFDIQDFELQNIRSIQVELKQKALLLIADDNVKKIATFLLDGYTIMPPNKRLSGGVIKHKSKKRRSKRRNNKSRRSKR